MSIGVYRKASGSTSISTAYVTDPIGFTPDTDKTILLFSLRNPVTNQADSSMVRAYINGSNVAFECDNANHGQVAEWQLLECFTGFSVQSGTHTASTASSSITLSSTIDPSRTWLIDNGIQKSGGYWDEDTQYTLRLAGDGGSIDVDFETNSASFTLNWMVVEFDSGEAYTQDGEIDPASSTSKTENISSVDSDQSIIQHWFRYNNNTDCSLSGWTSQFNSDTQIQFDREASDATSQALTYQVIEFSTGILVQTGLATLGSSTATSNPTLSTTIDPDRSLAIISGNTLSPYCGGSGTHDTDDHPGDRLATISIDGDGEGVTITRGESNETASFRWFTITFPDLIFSITASGGMDFSGASNNLLSLVSVASGGLDFSGVAILDTVLPLSVTTVTSGGLEFSGETKCILDIFAEFEGGLNFSGTSINEYTTFSFIPTWPSTLPNNFLQASFNKTIQKQSEEGNLKDGPPQLRRLFSAYTYDIVGTMIMTPSQKSTFDTFYNDTLGGGILQFNWLDLIDGVTSRNYKFVPGKEPTWGKTEGGNFIVNLTLRQMPF